MTSSHRQMFPLSSSPYRRFVFLFFQGLVLTEIAVALVLILGLEQSGPLSIVFSAVSLLATFNALMLENRDSIWIHQEGFWRSNWRTARGVLALFLGVFCAYALVALFLPFPKILKAFSGILNLAMLHPETPLSQRFAGIGKLLIHNYTVAGIFFILALIYRGFAVLISLGWNGCVWGLTLCLLIEHSSAHAALSRAGFALGAFAAILPHLILEATGYVFISLSGVFLSRGFSKYQWSNPRIRQVILACVYLVLIGSGLLFIAAVSETWFAPRILEMLETSTAMGQN